MKDSSVSQAIRKSLKLQIVMNGVWDIVDAIKNDISFQDHLSEQMKLDDGITEETLLDLINEFYDFNEFGGLTKPFISNLMDTLMPKYVQTLFINEVQDEILKLATERINEGLEN